MAQLVTDLTDYATLAAELGILSSDPRLPRLVSFASDAARNFLNRANTGIEYASAYVENVRGYRTPRIILTKTPVQSIASITWLGMTQDPTTYTLQEPDAGLVYCQTGFAWTGLEKNGMMQEDDVPSSEDRSIAVTYAGGWVTPGQVALALFSPRTLPYDLEDAVIQIARDRFAHINTDGNLQSEELGTAKAAYLLGGARHISPAAQALLLPYKKHFSS